MKSIFLVRHAGCLDCAYSATAEQQEIKPGKKNGPDGDFVMSGEEAKRLSGLLAQVGPTIELVEARVKVRASDVEIVAGPFNCETIQGDLPRNPLMTATKITTPKGTVKWSNARATHIDDGGNDLGGSVAGAIAKLALS